MERASSTGGAATHLASPKTSDGGERRVAEEVALQPLCDRPLEVTDVELHTLHLCTTGGAVDARVGMRAVQADREAQERSALARAPWGR